MLVAVLAVSSYFLKTLLLGRRISLLFHWKPLLQKVSLGSLLFLLQESLRFCFLLGF